MRDIYVCVIFLRVNIYWMFFYWSHFFDVHFSYCEVFMCQVLGGLKCTYTQRNLFESTRNQIVFNMHRLIWSQTDFRLVPFSVFINRKIVNTIRFRVDSTRFRKYFSASKFLIRLTLVFGFLTKLPPELSTSEKSFPNLVKSKQILIVIRHFDFFANKRNSV